jgi:hypothetical protein
MMSDESPSPASAEAPGDLFIIGEEGLAAWCAGLEERIAEFTRQNAELSAENERLAGRVRELSSILKELEAAFVIGRLRSGQPLPEPPSPGVFAELRGVSQPSGTPTNAPTEHEEV